VPAMVRRAAPRGRVMGVTSWAVMLDAMGSIADASQGGRS
jgi:hypothetical protein